MTDPVPSKDRLAELIADYQLRYDDRDCKCDTSDEASCKRCRGVCVCHFDFDTIAALKQLQKPAHERESPHCSTCACGQSTQSPGIPSHLEMLAKGAAAGKCSYSFTPYDVDLFDRTGGVGARLKPDPNGRYYLRSDVDHIFTTKVVQSQVLLPCPFCSYVGVEIRDNHGVYFVTCSDCGVTGPSYPTQESCAEDWNGAPRACTEPRVGDDQITRYIRALKEPAKAFQYCHPDTIRELVALLEELEQRRAAQPLATEPECEHIRNGKKYHPNALSYECHICSSQPPRAE